jgi:hypothetical protein
MRLHVVQADYGDCLILESGPVRAARYILIDGGPDGTYAGHLKVKLKEIADRKFRLDLVVLTHIDEDHVVGLVDMMSEIAQAHRRRETPVIEVGELWYNTFYPIQDNGSSSYQVDTFSNYLTSPFAGGAMQSLAYSISQAEDMWKAAHILGIPLNPTFAKHIVVAANAGQPVEIGDLKLWVIGPSQGNLDRFKKNWDMWFDKHKDDPYTARAIREAINIDTSISNLSSIMLLAEGSSRRILLTGDGKAEDVLYGLKQSGLTGLDGRLHVDVFKVPHHGSDRNSSIELYKKVTANHYVIPAGKHKNDDNPDLKTLVWIVKSAKKRGEKIKILVSNPNNNTETLQKKYLPDKYGYQLSFIPSHKHSVVV